MHFWCCGSSLYSRLFLYKIPNRTYSRGYLKNDKCVKGIYYSVRVDVSGIFLVLVEFDQSNRISENQKRIGGIDYTVGIDVSLCAAASDIQLDYL